MRKEAVSTQKLDYTTQSCTYKIVDTIQDVSSIMQSLTSMRTQQLALVIATLHFEHERKISLSKLAQIDQSVRYYLDNLRSLVRKTDVVCLLDRTFYFMLIGANLQGGSIVQERLWDALLWRVHNASDGEVLRPRSMTMGHSAYPTPYNNIHQCIAAASVARQSFDVQPEKSARQMSVSPSHDSDLSILARQLGIPYLSLLPRKLPTQIQQLISP